MIATARQDIKVVAREVQERVKDRAASGGRQKITHEKSETRLRTPRFTD